VNVMDLPGGPCAVATFTGTADEINGRVGPRLRCLAAVKRLAARRPPVRYQDFWKKVGMDVSVDTVDFPTLWGVRFHPGKFEAISFLWPSGFYPDPAVGLYPLLCANSRTGYCSAEMDRLIVAGRSALNPQERLRTYARFQELFARDLPFMWVVSPADLRLASPKLILPARQNDFLVMKAIMEWDLKE